MAAPGVNATHTDAVLTNISVGYMQAQTKFISTKLFPVVNVEKKSGLFSTYDRDDWFRDEAEKRADATESAGSGYNVGQDGYSADVYAFHKDVGDQLLANADAPFNPLREAAEFVASRMLLRQERSFVEDYLKPGIWTTELTGTATGSGAGEIVQFNDYANSDPIGTVEQIKADAEALTGLELNTAAIGVNVYRKLKNHPDIIDRIKYTSSENVTLELIARLLELDNVYISRSQFNAAPEGQEGKLEYNFGNGIFFAHAAPTPGLLTPSAGYTFAWTGVSDGSGQAIGTTQFRMDHLRAERIESQSAWDNKVVAPDLGVLVTDAVA